MVRYDCTAGETHSRNGAIRCLVTMGTTIKLLLFTVQYIFLVLFWSLLHRAENCRMSAFLLSPPCSSTSLAPFQEWSLSVSRDWADKSFSGTRVSTLEHKCPPGPWHDFTIHGNQDTSPWVRNSKYRGEMIYSSTFISPSSFIQLKSSSVNPGFQWMGWVVPQENVWHKGEDLPYTSCVHQNVCNKFSPETLQFKADEDHPPQPVERGVWSMWTRRLMWMTSSPSAPWSWASLWSSVSVPSSSSHHSMTFCLGFTSVFIDRSNLN